MSLKTKATNYTATLTILSVILSASTATSRASELEDLKQGYKLCELSVMGCRETLEQSGKVNQAQKDVIDRLSSENAKLKDKTIFDSPLFYLGIGLVGGVLLHKVSK